jgi:hypothetical protein
LFPGKKKNNHGFKAGFQSLLRDKPGPHGKEPNDIKKYGRFSWCKYRAGFQRFRDMENIPFDQKILGGGHGQWVI